MANQRKPGVIQTIDLVSHVNPTGRNKEADIRVLTLVTLNCLISQKRVQSAQAHDMAVDIIKELGIDTHPGGWGTRTWRTLPAQGQEPESDEIPKDTGEI